VRAAKGLVVLAVAACGLAVFEFFAADSWNRFVTETVGLPRYKIEILNVLPGTDPFLFDIRVYSVVAGRELLRIGGLLIDYLAFGYWVLIAVAIVLERQVRGLASPARGLALSLLALGVLFTQTRSAVLSLGVVVLLALRAQAGRDRAARVRLSLVAGAIGAIALPIVFAIGLGDRIVEGDEVSDTAHGESAAEGLDILLAEPGGRGLATSAGVGVREVGSYAVTTENQLLQIGTQLGVLGLVLWVATYALAVRTLRRAAAPARDGPRVVSEDEREVKAVVAAGATALIALVPAMFFAQVYIYLPVAWTLWGLAGAALGAVEGERSHVGVEEPALAQP
jgi:hypothetical protein